jgi:hypothetical protein
MTAGAKQKAPSQTAAAEACRSRALLAERRPCCVCPPFSLHPALALALARSSTTSRIRRPSLLRLYSTVPLMS